MLWTILWFSLFYYFPQALVFCCKLQSLFWHTLIQIATPATGRGHTTKFHTGRLCPYLQTLTGTIFTQKWYPFHIPCLELCTPFTCCKCTVLSVGIHDKNRTLSQLYKTMKFIGSTYDTFPYAFTNFTSQIRNLSYTWSPEKVPFWGGACPSKPL